MKRSTITTYSHETHLAIEDAKKILDLYQERLENTFIPDSYKQFYEHDFFHTSYILPKCASILQQIAQLKTIIRYEMLALFDSAPISPNDAKIHSYHILETSLYDIQSKIIVYPSFIFVGKLIETGTALDMIGYIEKMRYDRFYRKISDIRSDRLSGYIDEIKRAFDARYGEGAYLKVEAFKHEYLHNHSRSFDEIFEKREYISFMKALEDTMRYLSD